MDDETTLERIRRALKNVGLPAWASWIDRALEQQDARMKQLEAALAKAKKGGGT